MNDNKDFLRRRSRRNWVMFFVLLGLVVLFFAITIVKMSGVSR